MEDGKDTWKNIGSVKKKGDENKKLKLATSTQCIKIVTDKQRAA